MPEVKMYTTTWCGICVHTKRYLKFKNIDFEEIDIEEFPEIGDRIEAATGGYRIVPTLEINGKLMVNPSRREIDAAVAAPAPVAAVALTETAEQPATRPKSPRTRTPKAATAGPKAAASAPKSRTAAPKASAAAKVGAATRARAAAPRRKATAPQSDVAPPEAEPAAPRPRRRAPASAATRAGSRAANS